MSDPPTFSVLGNRESYRYRKAVSLAGEGDGCLPSDRPLHTIGSIYCVCVCVCLKPGHAAKLTERGAEKNKYGQLLTQSGTKPNDVPLVFERFRC